MIDHRLVNQIAETYLAESFKKPEYEPLVRIIKQEPKWTAFLSKIHIQANRLEIFGSMSLLKHLVSFVVEECRQFCLFRLGEIEPEIGKVLPKDNKRP